MTAAGPTATPSCTATGRRTAALLSTSVALLAAGTLGTASATAGTTTAAVTLSPVSGHEPERLVQSTGNLYWTHNETNNNPELGPPFSAVYRTSKLATPGQERPLHRMTHAGNVQFGALTYAKVGTTFYGYFAVNDLTRGTSVIKRVPLGVTDAPATPVTASPGSMRNRDLVADSAHLYWSDGRGLHRRPLSGGPTEPLATSSSITRVALHAGYVYYSLGTRIYRLSKTRPVAGPPVVSATSTVTALHVAGTTPTVYWGERNNAVRRYTVGGTRQTYQGPAPDRIVTSVFHDGSRLLWSHCTTRGDGCAVVLRRVFVNTTMAEGGVGAKDVQGDSSAAFWGDTNAVYRRTH